MQIIPIRRLMYGLAFLAVIAAATSWGSVFWRSRSSDPAGVTADRLGWAVAYQTTMKVNGGAAAVDVLQSEGSVLDALGQLKALYERAGAHVAVFPGERMGWGLVRTEGHIIRLLALALEERSDALVVRTSQSLEEYRAAGEPGRVLADLPSFPGSVPHYSVSDDVTRVDVEVSRARASPWDARTYIGRALRAAGWAPALRGVSAEASGALLFVKGHEVCGVSVETTGVSGESVITMFRKRLRGSEGL